MSFSGTLAELLLEGTDVGKDKRGGEELDL